MAVFCAASVFDKAQRQVQIGTMALDEKVLGVRLDRHHARLLEALSEFERLGQSECMRRALRHYCEALGVEPKQPPKRRARR